MKPTFIGFGPTKAHAVIFWIKDCDINHKTKCFDQQDIQDMLDKYNTPGSLYSSFDGYEITYLKANEGVA